MKPKIFIDGEHGTTGLQIRSRLEAREDIEIISIPEAERRNNDLREQFLREADVAILCLPDDGAREAVAMLGVSSKTRIIDTSTAHRTDPDWIYGFAESDPDRAEQIASARFVSNPGCYSTGAIGILKPLIDRGLMPSDYPVTINAVSGYTGGGKQLIAQMEDESHPEYLGAPHFLYGLTLKHKHVPEIKMRSGLKRTPLFSPSVGRFAQGMAVQVPLYLDEMEGTCSMRDVHQTLVQHYAGQSVVHVVPLDDSMQISRLDPTALNGQDTMMIYVFGTEGGEHVNVVAVLDNLGKGASGAAAQNLDLMLFGDQ
ncbi:N-acetyl-gamma-glutamyl-phosphate reductase [Pararhizobium haloflavum]|uniref:N-acetyl-gamma-glutamyl-phosphate reductase n=1 Tax=Pararhizobium haloflavum TaxID=2037914 RepID=UPI000C1951F4|nr:N-acetyl-gamma-glutamyl-phosphate reductase [Pararhizobium haloflavum]